MIPYPDIDPEIVRIGPFAVRWYSLMYLIGFGASYFLVSRQVKRRGLSMDRDAVSALYTYIIFGLIIGARIGYVLVYNPGYYLANPAEIVAVWHGGLSFHGGLVGSILAGYFFCRRYGQAFWTTADLVIATAPIGLGLGRLGNFINGELYGRVTDAPWGMVFPDGGPQPRHPSQLYEFFLEGVVLFTVLWLLKERNMKPGMITALFLIFYGLFRFGVEFFREPDAQLGLIAASFSMGQLLSAGMIGLGAVIVAARK